MHTPSQTANPEDAAKKEAEEKELEGQIQYRNPWPKTSDFARQMGFNGNGKCVSASVDARPPQHGAAVTVLDGQMLPAPILRLPTARRMSLEEDAYRLLFCADAVPHQLLSSWPPPHKMHPSG